MSSIICEAAEPVAPEPKPEAEEQVAPEPDVLEPKPIAPEPDSVPMPDLPVFGCRIMIES
jgi:hypothetical protein